jgi:dephospho-CoA kinase
MAKVIGLTGGFGTGKTYVASVFRSLGADVCDADAMAKAETAKGRSAYRRIVRAFGRGILARSGEIDRAALAAIVFSDRRSLRLLERIVHPAVIRLIRRRIARSAGDGVIVIDAPLLFEARLTGLADRVVVVEASLGKRMARISKRSGMKRSEILKRIRNQIPMRRKVGAADHVIDNDGTKSDTRRQVRKVWKEIVWR